MLGSPTDGASKPEAQQKASYTVNYTSAVKHDVEILLACHLAYAALRRAID